MDQTPIDRASSVDLMERAAGTSPAASQVGAILVLDGERPLDPADVAAALERRTRGIPRLRQRLRPTPLGCGRPVWVDDAGFDICRHVTVRRCPAPGDEAALLSVAADVVATALPDDRPRWAVTVVADQAGGTKAVVLTFDHVLADGMGGLAVLAHLVDGAGEPASTPQWRPPPKPWALAVDAWRSRAHALGAAPAGVRRLREAVTELGGGIPRAPQCSLNAPVGERRALAVARAPLDPVHRAAHDLEATVNDALLAVVAGTLGDLLRRRGEAVDHVVASLPVSARQVEDAERLGNAIGVMAVAVPVEGTAANRTMAAARATTARKQRVRGASGVLLAPAFRLLGAIGALRWVTEHQRAVTTFVTNLRGPALRLRFLGAEVTDVLPISSTSGNVRFAFGALSYAGTLAITVVADADEADELPALTSALEAELAALTAATSDGPAPP